MNKSIGLSKSNNWKWFRGNPSIIEPLSCGRKFHSYNPEKIFEIKERKTNRSNESFEEESFGESTREISDGIQIWRNPIIPIPAKESDYKPNCNEKEVA